MTNERLSGIEQPSGEHGPLYLQLINMYAPSWGYGGPVRMFFDYARWMSREFQVAVFTGNVHHDFTQILASSETIQGVRIHRNKLLFHRLTRKNHYLHSPLMCVRAAQRIRASRGPAIVHFSDLRGMVALYAMLLKLLYSKRVTLVHSAFGSLYFKRAVRRKIYDALFLKAFVRLVGLRLVQNEHERDAYEQICRAYGTEGPSQISLLPLHLDRVPGDPTRFTESGKNLTAVRNVRRAYGVPEDALVFLFLGRLHPSKGILRMMDAYLEFSRSCLRKTLVLIVGRDDGFQAKVEEYILRAGRPEIFRIVNNVYETRFDYYFLADIFLGFPTIYEETMLASIEAMACGTPMVVSREADIPFVEKERAGLVIDFNVRTAAEAMAAVTQDLVSFQRNARRVVARHFNGTAAAAKLRALFQMTISGNLVPEKGESKGIEPARLDENSCVASTTSVAAGK
jgi:glycosyltransferase involved in cell wall biosynthesis